MCSCKLNSLLPRYFADVSVFFCLFCVACELFFPAPMQAQEPAVASRIYSIGEDEEGGKLFMPSFVLSEPVMNETYIIDGKGRIVIYTSDFFPLFTLGERSGITSPQGLAVDREGNLYVAQGGTRNNPRQRIAVFNACLSPVGEIYFEGFEGADAFLPHRLALDGHGRLYVAGFHFPGVLVFDKAGRFLQMISPEHEGKKVNVSNVTVDKTGKIYLVSEEMSRIYVYNDSGKLLLQFGEKGGSSGKLSRPMAAAVNDRSGNVYVVDYMRHAVSIYDKEGKYLSEFGGLGWTEGWFQYPRDITVDAAGRVYVADTFNNRIEVFRPSVEKPDGATGPDKGP